MLDFLNVASLDRAYCDLIDIVGRGQKVNVLSAADSARPHAAAVVRRFVLYIARDAANAQAAAERLSCFFDGKVAALAAKDDYLIFKRGESAATASERLAVLRDLSRGKLSALVVSPESLMQYLPAPALFARRGIELREGQEKDLYKLTAELVASGYFAADKISAPGEFARRGDIVDIYPAAAGDSPLRVNFFGDTVESLRVIDPESMMGIRRLGEAYISPACDIIIDEGQIGVIAERIERQEPPKGADGARIKNISESALSRLYNGSYGGFEWIIPFVRENFSTVFEWLPPDAVIVYDEPNVIHERLKSLYAEFYTRVAGLTRSGEVYPVHKDSAINERDCGKCSDYPAVAFLRLSSLNPFFIPDAVLHMPSVKAAPYYGDFGSLISDLKAFSKSRKRTVLCCGNKADAKRLYDGLADKLAGIKLADCVPQDFEGIYIAPIDIKDGFLIEKSRLAVIGINDLFRKQKKVLSAVKKKTGYIPAVGDFVVHEAHGIGRFLGIEKVKTGGVSRDYGRIAYRGDDTLFVPVENLDRLSKYTGGDNPHLSKMGGAEFAKVKESVKKSIKQLAFSLLELYDKREKAAGFVYSKDTEWQKEFEDSFEFDETDDQLEAVDAIKRDLESGKVMDRLLCGDVGYGKTEVALRAIFKVVMDGKQAAILAPTTILARQHYNTILARTREFKLNVGILSRFETREEIAAVIDGLKSGAINVVSATHRLLSKDVEFQDLGLLVLDEEQRFGVEHKEKIKTIKNNVNVLTLSATPIPRTLHMSLSGIRDISLLETPPKNRIPVETYVTEYSDGLITDAVLREKARGGQTFILYNRVEDIDGFASAVSRLFEGGDDIKIIVAHGRMNGNVLDEKMTAFYNGEADILICTTIIENGLDLPNANTIIICDADRLGLATLYQLRGRVGRSGLTARAYFTYAPNRVMNENAMKRLNAIMDYTDFGSGYKLARRDLEIRGAGNVLGAEQHGHMEKVGYEMYSRMLKEAIGEIRGGEEAKAGAEAARIRETEIRFDADIDMYIDEKYMSAEQRVEAYSQIARIDGEAAKEQYIKTLTEAYGSPPLALLNLIDIAVVKNAAAKIDAVRIMINSQGLGIVFNNAFTRRAKLISVISKSKNMLLTGNEKTPTLVFNVKNMNSKQKMEVLKKFLALAEGYA
ncbi:MAG: transcription-repair coupling factor [Clostridiales bacterium]|jgi:transcription-repair coupling factor (superfamily II helicase)|nr:transcription-repair coupling factor [Clostridiales bacterium]